MSGRLGPAASLVAAILITVSARAENRFSVSEEPLIASDEPQQIEVLCENDVKILGYSFGLQVDPEVLQITDVTATGTVAESFDLDGDGADETADFFDGTFIPEQGIVGYGVVFDLPDASVPELLGLTPGTDRVIGKIELLVLISPTVTTTTTVSFAETQVRPLPTPAVKNVMTNPDGFSITPDATDAELRLTLVDGTIPIDPRLPAITSIENNKGLPGQVFQIVGENFGEPDLSVNVCETRAEATLRKDGVTIDVTAPACELTDFVPVEVCTARGCVTEEQGFCYQPPPAPVITSYENNSGMAGTQFTIIGENFDEGVLTVSVCGAVAENQDPTDGGTRVVVTAPGCVRLGPAEVEVCNSFGCVTDPEGFVYEDDQMGPRFVRGDVDSDNDVNITDGIRVLGFLFTGREDPACFDAADVDDSGDIVITDAVIIFNWLFIGGVPPADPSPSTGAYLPGDCGEDTTPDIGADLGCATRATKCEP